MKNRKLLVSVIMIVAVMCVGVGYAAMTSTNTFNGKITYDAAFQLKWVEVTSGDIDLGSPTITDSSVTVNIDTTAWTAGETKTITAKLNNPSHYNATNVTVTPVQKGADLDDYNIVVEKDFTTLAVGETKPITIKITMGSYPVEDVTDATFSFTVTAEQSTL